ncbi:MAG: ATP-binding protein [Tepidimonas sp.]|nr:ATP-binding protein [Tepidimonas sp.]
MNRFEKQFNTAGPSIPGDHYLLDPLRRIDLGEVLALIEAKRYFVLHAPRQTGKTTALLALMEHLNAQGCYRALYANIETAQAARGVVARGIAAACNAIALSAAIYLGDKSLDTWLQREGPHTPAESLLTRLLAYWSAADPQRPAVLLLDEVDALVGDTLISLLRQIRAGYAQRPQAFPQTVVLCGVRDVRDYRIHSGDGEIITGGSAFNIKAKSLRLGNFSFEETRALWQQHTEATGQRFEEAIWAELWEDTRGQPWLVNALGHECTWKDKELRHHREQPVTLERYKAARERLIQSRATHLDQLTDKLREARVHRVIAAILAADDTDAQALQAQVPLDDLQYVEDLGLIQARPQWRIANRIYREIIPRELTYTTQTRITHEQAWYVRAQDRRLDMDKLLAAFQQFFRENAEAWIERFQYKEAGPQLLLQAFLQRIVNGGGRISREYGLGRRRTDLLLEWPLDDAQGFVGPVQRVVLELKILHKSLEATLQEGLQQTADYAQQCGAEEAHLIIFDRRPDVSWDEKIFHRTESIGARTVGVWGM